MKAKILDKNDNIPFTSANNSFQTKYIIPPERKPYKKLAVFALFTSSLSFSCAGLASNGRPPQSAEMQSQDQVVNQLIQMLERNSNFDVREDAARALGKIGTKKALPALIRVAHPDTDRGYNYQEGNLANVAQDAINKILDGNKLP